MGKGNAALHRAKREKNDEFFTQKKDIEKELIHYHHHLKDKIVYCNCDDYRKSKFVEYFMENFEKIGLKKLISTGFSKDGQGTYSEYDGTVFKTGFLSGNGDALEEECTEILKQADVVVTNPPFSLFRKYVSHLMKYGKKFLIVGSMNAITYKEIFPYIKNNELWMGVSISSGGREFRIPDNYEVRSKSLRIDENGNKYVRVNGVRWFTNIPHNHRNEPLDLYKKYSADEYPKYQNYDAIEVSKVSEIPMDYYNVIGVPITFLDKYCPTQFEILWLASGHSKTTMPKDIAEMLNADFEMKSKENAGKGYAILDGHQLYHRILIRKKK